MLQKIFFAIVILLAAVCVSGAIFGPEPKVVEVRHTVVRGQTLWSIAGKLQEEYGDKRDIREIMYEAADNNGIKGHIYPGQTIVFKMEVPQW